MSNVNDNNLDDLLRRAAEKYPLRTDSADWGKLVADLDKDPSLILPPVNGEDGRRRRRFFWLFLLLPLAGAGYYTWHMAGRSASVAGQTNAPVAERKNTSGTGQTNAVAGKDKVAPVNAGEKREDVSGKDTRTRDIAGGETAGQTGQANIATIEKGRQTDVPGQDRPTSGMKQERPTSGARQERQTNGVRQERETNGTAGKDGQVRASVLTNARPGNGGHAGGENAPAGEKGGGVSGAIPGQSGATRGQNGATPGQSGQAGLISGRTGNVSNGQDERGLHLASNNLQRVNTKMRGDVAAGNISLKSDAVGQTKDNAKKDKIRLQKPKSSFYVGILGSPDLSTIKWQSVKNVGATYGLLLGYSFNSRWSIESGVYYSKKKYYTAGEYFDKSKAYILKYVDSLKVDGTCDMWEIPLNVRYNLSTSEKTKWFATAGVSAYYMSNEKYYCWGNYNGNPAWHESWDKRPSQNSWSANLSLSVGYEQRLGKIGNLRLEPYVRVPITGIGTGKLSIMSAGLNIGITRRIW